MLDDRFHPDVQQLLANPNKTHFIGGKSYASNTEGRIPIVNPATGRPVATFNRR